MCLLLRANCFLPRRPNHRIRTKARIEGYDPRHAWNRQPNHRQVRPGGRHTGRSWAAVPVCPSLPYRGTRGQRNDAALRRGWALSPGLPSLFFVIASSGGGTRKARAVSRPSPQLRHDEPTSQLLRMIFNEGRVVAPAFRRRRYANRPHATAGSGGNRCEAGVRPRPEARARNHRPHAVLTLQDERIVIGSVDVPPDCPGRAIGRCRSGKLVVFAGAPVGSCLYGFSARYSRSHKGRVRHGVRLLLAHDSQYRRRRRNSDREYRSGRIGGAGDNAPTSCVPVFDKRLVGESGASLVPDSINVARGFGKDRINFLGFFGAKEL